MEKTIKLSKFLFLSRDICIALVYTEKKKKKAFETHKFRKYVKWVIAQEKLYEQHSFLIINYALNYYDYKYDRNKYFRNYRRKALLINLQKIIGKN